MNCGFFNSHVTRRVLSLVLAAVLFLGMVAVAPVKAEAAAAGTMISNAVKAEFGKTYYKSWTKDTDHLSHYVKVVLNDRGFLTIEATKPFDSEGEYADLEFAVYDEDGEPVWCYDTRFDTTSAKPYYEISVGLAAGTYYVTILPGFYVRSGIIETEYTMFFDPMIANEIEPNSSGATATEMTPGYQYGGYFGNGGAEYGELDYYKFNVVAGNTYRVTVSNMGKLGSTMIDLVAPGEKSVCISFKAVDYMDEDGNNYYEFKAKSSGTAFIYLENYQGKATYYALKVTNRTCEINGHEWNVDYVIKEPTVTEDGLIALSCGNCGSATEMVYELFNPFVDISEDKFYYEPVLWAYYSGITTGKDEVHFNPSGECTRAQVVTFLWRAAGWPVPTNKVNPFPDVAGDKYYTDAVLWAVENGITGGFKDGTFGPNKTCTRAQIVTFLWRAAGEPAPQSMVNPFPDVDVNAYYGQAVLWAVENGITGGYKDGTFGPNKTCTRDQIVTFLFRYMGE